MHRLTAVLIVLSLAAGTIAHTSTSAHAAGAQSADARPTPETVDAVIEGFGGDFLAQSVDGLTAGSDGASTTTVSRAVEAPIPFSMVGFDVPAGQPVRFRTSTDGENWSSWQVVSEMDEGPDGAQIADADGRVPTSPAWVGESRWLQVDAADPTRIRAHVIDTMGQSSGTPALASPATDAAGVAGATTPAGDDDQQQFYAAAAGRPAIISRATWGAGASSSSRVAGDVRHAVVHHTASTNDYSRDEVPAIVRGFHRYHTQTQGWADIGYNFLIDKYGRIYEGRGGGIYNAVVGAHARGFNTGSVGVSLIGNFDTAAPTKAALLALRQLLAWKLGVHGVDPTSTVSIRSGGSPKYSSGTTVTLPAINAHRDTGHTSCPGKNLYSLLANLRKAVEAEMAQRSVPVAEYARLCLPEEDPGVGPVWRVQGDNRIATAIAASKWYWRAADTAIVANAYDFPDALAAGALAAKEDAPLLLTAQSELHPAVAKRLQEMGVRHVYVMGGTTALSPRVDSELDRLGMTVTRVAGSNRYATAASAASRVGASSGEVTLALGTHEVSSRAWPDAVAAGALAATPQRLPTLLTRPGKLPADTADALRSLDVDTVWILGDITAVSADVQRTVESMGITVRRLAGKTRYGTSAAAAAEARRRHNVSRSPLVIASGANFPDALAGAAVAARRGAPLLLVPPCGLEQAPDTAAYLKVAAGQYHEAVILGSAAATSERIRWQIGLEFAGS